MEWLERAPMWVIGLAVLAGLLLAHETALRLARRGARSVREDGETRGFLVSSALTVLGLMLAFTFGAAQDRYRHRQDLVVAEANAIGTSYLRVQLLDPPWSDQLSRELLAYTQGRLRFPQARAPQQIEANAAESDLLQERIWSDLSRAAKAGADPAIALALVLSLNETFDLAASRRAAREVRVPAPVLRNLLICCLIVFAVLGGAQAHERRHTALLLGAMLVVTLAFCLILDLDRPTSARVQIIEGPMQRTLGMIRTTEAAKLRPPP